MSDLTLGKQAQAALTRRLSLELMHIYRSHDLQSLIQPARINLTQSTQYLGMWSPKLREISLSCRLALSYSWSEIIEFMKHEVAHQIVDEHLGGTDQPHGPTFLKACDLICVAAWARHPRIHNHPQSPSLHSLIGDQSSPIELKITKLLKLSESSNPHEAALAMTKVRELQAKYALTAMGDLTHSPQKMHFVSIATGLKRRNAHLVLLSHILSSHFQVQCIFTQAYAPLEQCDYIELELIGYPKNLLMAEHVYHYLQSTCKHLWKQHLTALQRQNKTTQSSTRVAKSSFIEGLLEGFDAKLKRQIQDQPASAATSSPSSPSSAASIPESQPHRLAATFQHLAAAHQKALDSYMAQRYPHTRTKRLQGRRHDPSLYQEGRKASKNLRLDTPIKGQESGPPLQIGASK